MKIEEIKAEKGRKFRISEIEGTDEVCYFHVVPEYRGSTDLIYTIIEKKIEEARKNNEFPFN